MGEAALNEDSVEVIYDVPRIEEKLILKALKELGLKPALTSVKEKPLQFDEGASKVCMIRPVSMYRAAYSAAVRESSGCTAINSSSSILCCGDKILTLSKLVHAGLRVPRSIIAMSLQSAEKAYKMVGMPLIDKPPIGGWGRLVSLVNDEMTGRNVLEHREMMTSQQLRIHIVQEYIRTPGRDIRGIVLDGELLGTMYRYRQANDWRSNVALGAKVVGFKPSEELSELCIKAAEVIGGTFVSVDMLEGEDGYLINEVNGVPEFKAFMRATRKDVAMSLARYVLRVLKG